ncbi:DivIVA domain-containing protein [Streptomyces sp. CMB-StM0423]|uniref:DivIVA domain-containing protein n=1 Tax=Streptomyces sp. CMB-StM0423 TaxID=2059884 RepID=UPI000C70CB30|nr:DivIVA domain-containing protein [Streptomyces sp. CMB-StM0423]AUH40791.1 DivIVA domain-containing protein [Streptomyces sp. CMB-StM0423]
MFWFMLIAMVAVVAAVTVVLAGNGEEELTEPLPDRLHDPLPPDRPLGRADIDALRLPVALRGYRMDDVDDALDRVAAELAERDARIAELEAALAGAHAAAYRGGRPGGQGYEDAPPGPAFGGAGGVAAPEGRSNGGMDLGTWDLGGRGNGGADRVERDPGGLSNGGTDLSGRDPRGPDPGGAEPRDGLDGRA